MLIAQPSREQDKWPPISMAQLNEMFALYEISNYNILSQYLF